MAPPPARRSDPLSPREVEILGLVAQGFRNADVAKRLFISPKTVKTHLQHIYAKLDVNSRTEAAVKAKEAGLLS
jgi:DNA-binding NarL/FixJ family response regulator